VGAAEVGTAEVGTPALVFGLEVGALVVVLVAAEVGTPALVFGLEVGTGATEVAGATAPSGISADTNW